MDRRYYFIPNNFMDFGSALNGRFDFRNFLEGVVLAIIGMMICNSLPIQHGFEGAQNYVLFMLPPFLLGAAGIQGEPLSVFIFYALQWSRKNKPSFYNYEGRAYHMSAAELMDSEPSLRDMFADKLDTLAASMRKAEVTYVHGENYEFREDPEVVALDEAERKLFEEIYKKKDEPKSEETRTASGSVDIELDIENISANIIYATDEED